MIALADPSETRRLVATKTADRVVELQKTISASRLSLWHQCRLKFYFQHVLRLTKPPTPARHVGKVVHAVLQAWNKARWRKEPFVAERFKTILERDWSEMQKTVPIRWEGKEDQQRQVAWLLLETYFAKTPIPADEKPVGVEVQAEADLSAHGLPTLRGILDLVRPTGVIVDFKSAGQTPNAAKAAHLHEAQTSSYAVLYREATGAKESGIELHHLVKLKTPKLVVTAVGPMTEKQETRLFRSIESYVEGLGRRDFVQSPGLQCVCCEFFHECGRWEGNDNAGNRFEAAGPGSWPATEPFVRRILKGGP
jgi:CRISPR/Cas system-associated exonuclease Cas4 (RecB family)